MKVDGSFFLILSAIVVLLILGVLGILIFAFLRVTSRVFPQRHNDVEARRPGRPECPERPDVQTLSLRDGFHREWSSVRKSSH